MAPNGTTASTPTPPSTRVLVWRGLRWTLVIFAILVFVWAAGLVWFAATMPRRVSDTTTHTDAIVVLTGGSGRIEEGLRLLKAGYAPLLFVSGVNPKLSRRDVMRLLGDAAPALGKRVLIGYRAEHTRGNAIETAMWANAQRLRSLRLVTANYHMRRSLLELSKALPGVVVIPNPVFPEGVRPGKWWHTWSGFQTVFLEYNKYLAALLIDTFTPTVLRDRPRWS
jgi:uncharacterized SAM-binding protein YcdF (DUF218 family)